MILSCCCFKTIILNDILAPIFREVILGLARFPLPFVAGKFFFILHSKRREIYMREIPKRKLLFHKIKCNISGINFLT